jgi:FMN phosphatase YigB (HAD superfamily)
MPLTVLFDLDDTLLSTHMDKFLPGYFKRLGKALSHLGSPDQITTEIQSAVKAMVANQDAGKTLKEVFAENFYPALETTEAACQQVLEAFYRFDYPKLKPITQPRSPALELVDWCRSQGMQMVIATNPLFPETATLQRMQWGNLDPDQFAFFTAYDDFHFTKPHLTYYAEVLGRLGWPERPAVMIGDNLTYDLFPMDTMGYATFWINNDGHTCQWEGGSLSDVMPWLERILQRNEQQSPNLFEVQVAILRSTPAVWDHTIRQVLPNLSDPDHHLQRKQMIELLASSAKQEKEHYLPLFKKHANDQIIDRPQPEVENSLSRFASTEQDPDALLFEFLETRNASLALIEEIDLNSSFDSADRSGSQVDPVLAEVAHQDQVTLRKLRQLLDIHKRR